MLTRFTRLGCGTGKPGFSFAMRARTTENLMAKKDLHFSLWLYFSTQADLLRNFRCRSSCREGWQEPRQTLAVSWGQVSLQADWTLPTSPGRPTRQPPTELLPAAPPPSSLFSSLSPEEAILVCFCIHLTIFIC